MKSYGQGGQILGLVEKDRSRVGKIAAYWGLQRLASDSVRMERMFSAAKRFLRERRSIDRLIDFGIVLVMVAIVLALVISIVFSRRT